MREKQMTAVRRILWLISALIVLLVVAVGFILPADAAFLCRRRNKLEHANEQLQLSNNIKEEYRAVAFHESLLRLYQPADTYRQMVDKKISAGQMEELLKMVRSPRGAGTPD